MNLGTNRAEGRRRNLSVYLFNVGQGDNILLRLPNGEYGVIDFFYEAALNLAEPPALTYLKRIRRRLNSKTPIVISFICLSHPDTDHIKGAKQLLDWVKDKDSNVMLRNLWMWPGTVLEELLERYEEYARSTSESHSTRRASEVRRQIHAILRFCESFKEVEYLQDIRKLTQDAGGSIKAVTVAPLGTLVKKFNKQAQRAFVKFTTAGQKGQSPPKNLLSSILMLIYEDHRLLFGGDTMLRVWEECLKRYYDRNHDIDHGPLRGNFIKASHHGSKHSSSVTLWPQILLPKAHVGISAGRRTTYGHPHKDTLDQITSAPAGNSSTQIVSTNSCQECVGQQPWQSKILDWVGKRPVFKEPLREEVVSSFNEALELERTMTRKFSGQTDHKDLELEPARFLAAYIYRFDPDETIRVFKGVTSSVRSDDVCVFKTETSLPFPQCILQSKIRR